MNIGIPILNIKITTTFESLGIATNNIPGMAHIIIVKITFKTFLKLAQI